MVWQKGQSGNPSGRHGISQREMLWQAIREVEEEKGKSLWRHCVEMAYTDPLMAREILRKFVPDMREANLKTEGTVDVVRSLFASIYQAVQRGEKPPPALPEPTDMVRVEPAEGV